MDETTINRQMVTYAELTPAEFRTRLAEAPVAYLPLGTLEFHGEHMPLGSDAIQPAEFFKEIATEAGGIVLPALFLGPDRVETVSGTEYYGKDNGNHASLETQQYEPQILTGSAYWIPGELFILIMEGILKQLKRQGFKILVAHGHGPSTRQVINHTQKWEEEFGMRIFNLWGSENDDWNGFMSDHGAMLETSVVMKYRQDLVQLENLPRNPGQWPTGIRGYDPRTYASAEKGDEIVKIQKNRILNKLKWALNQSENTI
jgi:creatinine amidohydrolase